MHMASKFLRRNSHLATFVCVVFTAFAVGIGETKNEESFPYRTVKEARKAVTKIPGVTLEAADGWFIVTDRSARTTWTFPERDELRGGPG
jgi:hypothetical protein